MILSMAALLHLKNIALFLSLIDYSSANNRNRTLQRNKATTNLLPTKLLNNSSTEESDVNQLHDNFWTNETNDTTTNIFHNSSQEEHNVEKRQTNSGSVINWDELLANDFDFWKTFQSLRNLGCIINWNDFDTNDDDFQKKTFLTFETNETTTNLNVQCKNQSFFKIWGGIPYDNKTYLDTNTFSCVNGTLQDKSERRFTRQNIECHQKMLCGGQTLMVRFIKECVSMLTSNSFRIL